MVYVFISMPVNGVLYVGPTKVGPTCVYINSRLCVKYNSLDIRLRPLVLLARLATRGGSALGSTVHPKQTSEERQTAHTTRNSKTPLSIAILW